MISDCDLPTETGFYWAKERNYKWWNLIIHVYGTSPYLRVEIWKINSERIILDKDRYSMSIEEIGIKIERP